MTDAETLNQTVWATIRPSSIHGVGVFAIRNIPKGTRLTTNTIMDLREPKRVLSMKEKEFDSILPEIRELILDRIMFSKNQPLTFYSPNDVICIFSFMNHSDTPNSSQYTALRDIAKGEEITESFKQLDGYEDIHPYSIAHNKSIFQK